MNMTRKIRVRVGLNRVQVVNGSPVYDTFSNRVRLGQPAGFAGGHVYLFLFFFFH
jgi:hypothetical protein